MVLIAKTYGCGIAIEDLKFKNDKDVHSKFSRIKHQYEWSKWNEINKSIKGKVGENPDLWLINRRKILGIVN